LPNPIVSWVTMLKYITPCAELGCLFRIRSECHGVDMGHAAAARQSTWRKLMAGRTDRLAEYNRVIGATAMGRMRPLAHRVVGRELAP
jgi:hypothetical protein